MTLLNFLGNLITSPIVASIVGIRRTLELATQTLADVEKRIRTPDRDEEIKELKARIEHLESLLQPKSE